MGFLDDAGGYTPIIDHLVKRYDFATAYVWGVVWRYTQMEQGVCKAAHDTLAKRAGMSRRSLIDKLDVLIKDGYIEDLTPEKKNKPHTYNTKKGEELIKSTVQNLHSKKGESAEIAQSEQPTMQNSHTHYAISAQPTMQNLHLKKDSKETPLRESSPNGEAAKPPLKPHSIPAVQVFVEVTGKYCLSKPQMQEIREVIGDSPTALEKWREVVKAWVMKGFKPTNAAGMLEWFRNGIPVYQNGATNNGHKPTKQQRQQSPIIPLTPAEQEQFARMAALANDTG